MSKITEDMAKVMNEYEDENWREHVGRASVPTGVDSEDWAFAEKLAAENPYTAGDFLHVACEQLEDRASQRDAPDGERSMRRCVEAFNALYGTALTETQGWQFMSLLKKARAAQGEYRADDFVDDVAYAALAGESESRP